MLPAFRPGEALEIVPGLAVTQHSGDGKANQYFARGYNLDHGTDLALYLDSMPLNMRTHGHGQGYADANFVIPEMLAYVDARKGAYNVEDGDFSNAGTIRMQYLRKVPQGVFSTTGGAFNMGRVFGMKSWEFAGGDIFGGGEVSTYDGPWIVPNQARKIKTGNPYKADIEQLIRDPSPPAVDVVVAEVLMVALRGVLAEIRQQPEALERTLRAGIRPIERFRRRLERQRPLLGPAQAPDHGIRGLAAQEVRLGAHARPAVVEQRLGGGTAEVAAGAEQLF